MDAQYGCAITDHDLQLGPGLAFADMLTTTLTTTLRTTLTMTRTLKNPVAMNRQQCQSHLTQLRSGGLKVRPELEQPRSPD